jgi:predicted GNAT family N-acyltransferase
MAEDHASWSIRLVGDERDWESAKSIRTVVFIDKQACPPEEEWDAFDAVSRHFLGRVGDRPVATARWRVVDYEGRPAARLERFAVLPAFRRLGYGARMVQRLVEDARQAGHDVIFLHAQAHLEAFYGRLGFKRSGERFMEANIPHVPMRYEPEKRGP